MKRFFLLFVLAACGGDSNPNNDAGNNPDATSDATQSNDASTNDSANDSSTSDASNDVTTTGDGGLGAGDICDPKNDQCAKGLLCCSEPTTDASTGYFCEKPVNKGCPLLP